jgi:metal-responsive CopG/Arc/MetJ family transcriptional regulator
MVQVTINLDAEVLTQVDDAALERQLSRSRFIADCIAAYFAPKEVSTTEVVLLNNKLEHLNEIIAIREAEMQELKETNARLWSEWHDANERLIQAITRT